jgi:hypothetical protein
MKKRAKRWPWLTGIMAIGIISKSLLPDFRFPVKGNPGSA